MIDSQIAKGEIKTCTQCGSGRGREAFHGLCAHCKGFEDGADEAAENGLICATVAGLADALGDMVDLALHDRSHLSDEDVLRSLIKNVTRIRKRIASASKRIPR